MKKYKNIIRYIFFTSIFLLSLNLTAQNCTREVADFGTPVPGGYEVNGKAILTDSSGILKLRFTSDFSTTPGPDLYIYLSLNEESPEALGNSHIEVAQLAKDTGAQSYIVPGNVDINQFNYVLIHCKAANHLWDGGMLGPNSCGPTDLNIISEEQYELKIFPNPVMNELQVISSHPIESMKVINNLGEEIFESYRSKMNVQELPRGSYFLKILYENKKQTIAKFIKL